MEPMTSTTPHLPLAKEPADEPAGDPAGAPTADPAAAPTPPPPPAAPEAAAPTGGFRLHRSRTDRMLGGVCGGLAESLGVDATLLRLGLVALTLLGSGIGVPLYLAAWLLVPESDGD